MPEKYVSARKFPTQRRKGAKRYRVSKGISLRLCAFAWEVFSTKRAPRAISIIAQALSLLLVAGAVSFSTAAAPGWRVASEPELRKIIPARAPVIKENIETEFRTASGVTDGQGKFIAGVVMITAGYSAEGKYSHFFIAQVPVKIGEFSLAPGEYVFGYQRKTPDSIGVTFYRASSGDAVGEVEAFRNRKSSMVRALLIQPAAGGRGTIQVGRFVFDYHL